MIDDFYVVDIYVPSKKLILEVQGPSHKVFLGQATTKTVLKTKVLKKLGYKVASIDAMPMLKLRNYLTKDRALRARSYIMTQINFLNL